MKPLFKGLCVGTNTVLDPACAPRCSRKLTDHHDSIFDVLCAHREQISQAPAKRF